MRQAGRRNPQKKRSKYHFYLALDRDWVPSGAIVRPAGAHWGLVGTWLSNFLVASVPFGSGGRQKRSRMWTDFSIRRGSAQKWMRPGRDPQNMGPGKRKSHVFRYHQSSIFGKNRWEFQSGSCHRQNSDKLAGRKAVAGTRWPAGRRLPEHGLG